MTQKTKSTSYATSRYHKNGQFWLQYCTWQPDTTEIKILITLTTLCDVFKATLCTKIYHIAFWSKVEALELLKIAWEKSFFCHFYHILSRNRAGLFYVCMKSTLWYTVVNWNPHMAALEYIQAFSSKLKILIWPKNDS